MKPIPAIILAPLIAHPIQAVLMFVAPIPLHTIGIDACYKVMPGPGSAAALMLAASVAAWLSHLERWHGTVKGFALIAVQQFLMLLTLWTVIIAVFEQRYANGYTPPEGRSFILADQILFSVVSILHTIQVWWTYVRRGEPLCKSCTLLKTVESHITKHSCP